MPLGDFRFWTELGKRYLLYKLGRPKPLYCAYLVTNRCNLSCSYCPIGSDTDPRVTEFKKRTGKELSADEAKYAVDQLERIGVLVLTFSGGEPLLRKDLEAIAAHAKGRGMKTILATNGILLDRDRGRGIDECFDEVLFSIGGTGGLRGRRAFERLRRSIGHVRRASRGLTFLVNKYSLGEVERALDFARENCDFIYYCFVHFADEFRPSRDEAEIVGEELLRIKRENKGFVQNSEDSLGLVADFFKGEKILFCDPFDLHLILGPDGGLGGCCWYPYPAGNILREDIEEIYARKDTEKEILRRSCSGCLFFAGLSLAFRKPFHRNLSPEFLNKYVVGSLAKTSRYKYILR